MARLDIRVDGRTQFSRTVDDAVVARVIDAAVAEPRKVKRNFGGEIVKDLDAPKRKPRKQVSEKALSGQSEASETTIAHGEVAQA